MPLFEELQEKAAELGFARLAVAHAGPFEQWRAYMQSAGRTLSLTHDPQEALPGARSLIVAALPYRPFSAPPQNAGAVSAYYLASQKAFRGAEALGAFLSGQGYAAKASPNLPYKEIARRAGLGSHGRNTLLLHPQYGSMLSLAVIATQADLPHQSAPPPPYGQPCARCRACVTRCPVSALNEDGGLDVSACVRSHMLSGQAAPMSVRPHMAGRLIGCDDCRACCPHNRGAQEAPYPADLADIGHIPSLLSESPAAMKARMGRLSAYIGDNLSRPRRMRAQAALASCACSPQAVVPALRALLGDECAATRCHAAYALARFGERADVKSAMSRETDPSVASDMALSLAGA